MGLRAPDAGRRVGCLPHRTGHGANIFAYSPDGLRIASSGYDHLVKEWVVEERAAGRGPGWNFGQLSIRYFQGHSDLVTACAYSPDGRRIVSGSWDNTLQVWTPR